MESLLRVFSFSYRLLTYLKTRNYDLSYLLSYKSSFIVSFQVKLVFFVSRMILGSKMSMTNKYAVADEANTTRKTLNIVLLIFPHNAFH